MCIVRRMSSTETINVTAQPITEVVHDKAMFLQTPAAQGIAGIFVWAALFITCQQVNEITV